MENDWKVGGEVDSWCTHCKAMKWHVIVAMVGPKISKAECNGCHKQHAYKPVPPGTPKPKAPKAKKSALPPPAPPVSDLATKLAGGEGAARTYSPKDSYAIEEFVRHPQFGVGMVVSLPSAQKMEVAFRDGRKIMVHQRGAGPLPPMTLTRPVRTEDAPGYVTDAPPPGGKGPTE